MVHMTDLQFSRRLHFRREGHLCNVLDEERQIEAPRTLSSIWIAEVHLQGSKDLSYPDRGKGVTSRYTLGILIVHNKMLQVPGSRVNVFHRPVAHSSQVLPVLPLLKLRCSTYSALSICVSSFLCFQCSLPT